MKVEDVAVSFREEPAEGQDALVAGEELDLHTFSRQSLREQELIGDSVTPVRGKENVH
jgi:hypothetical protein